MTCLSCKQEGVETLWGCWCDRCGGVALDGPAGPRLFFRHVATADGAGGRFPIVWDISTADYAVLLPKRNERKGRDEDGFRPPTWLTAHGSLDAVIAAIQPYAQGDSEEWPVLSAAPTATEAELDLLRQ